MIETWHFEKYQPYDAVQLQRTQVYMVVNLGLKAISGWAYTVVKHAHTMISCHTSSNGHPLIKLCLPGFSHLRYISNRNLLHQSQSIVDSVSFKKLSFALLTMSNANWLIVLFCCEARVDGCNQQEGIYGGTLWSYLAVHLDLSSMKSTEKLNLKSGVEGASRNTNSKEWQSL